MTRTSKKRNIRKQRLLYGWIHIPARAHATKRSKGSSENKEQLKHCYEKELKSRPRILNSYTEYIYFHTPILLGKIWKLLVTLDCDAAHHPRQLQTRLRRFVPLLHEGQGQVPGQVHPNLRLMGVELRPLLARQGGVFGELLQAVQDLVGLRRTQEDVSTVQADEGEGVDEQRHPEVLGRQAGPHQGVEHDGGGTELALERTQIACYW